MAYKDIILSLKKKYTNLREVFITTSVYNYSDQKVKLGRKAAEVFENVLLNYDYPKVGIGGGSTIYNMVNSLSIKERKIRIYPTALIGRGPEVTFIDSTFLVTYLYLKSKPLAKAFAINIPPLPNTEIEAKIFNSYLLKNISELKWLYSSMQNEIDITFIGLGATIPTGDFDNEMTKLGLSIQSLKNQNIVGGINYNWFKNNGEQCFNYFLSISIKKLIEQAQSPNKVVALIAGGMHKLEPLKVALQHGMVNYLITDHETSKKLIKD